MVPQVPAVGNLEALFGVYLIPPCLTVALVEAQVLPTDGANCRVRICGPSLNYMGFWSNEPNTMNL